MSWRRLRVLIQHLPPESATWTALRNSMSEEELAEQAEKAEPEKGRWSQAEQLLATIADRIALLQYAYVSAHIESKAKLPARPEPVRRPGAKAPRPKPQMSEGAAEFLYQLINGAA
jgi:hypothetical protein